MTAVLSASRAGLGSVVVIDPTTTPITISVISNIGVVDPAFIKQPGAAAMDGQAQMLVAGIGLFMGVARMDGHSEMEAFSVIPAPGVAVMDGQAQMSAVGAAWAVGAAEMDGQAQMGADSIDMSKGAARMDGFGRLDGISVEGAGVAYMDGEASMAAVAPVIHKGKLLENLISGQALSLRLIYKPVLSQAFVASEIMKPKVRYHLVLNNAIDWSSTISFKMRFPKVIREVAITVTPSLAPHTHFHYTVTFPMDVGATLTPKFQAIYNMVQNLSVYPTTILKSIWGRKLTEAIKVPASLNINTQYHVALAQLFKLLEIEAFKLRHPVALSQNINLSQSLIGGIALKLLQKFQIATAPSPAFTYHLTLAGKIVTRDTLEHLVDALLEQLFTVHDTPSRQYVAKNLLAQLIAIQPALGNKLVLKIVGNIQVSPEQLVHMLYRGDELLDSIEITALFISPSGTTTTWAINTRTAAVTEYMNYDFHSFAQMGDRYIAAGDDGLYELDGDTDDGDLIVSRLMGGYLQLNNKKLFGLKGVYIAMRGGGRFYLKLIAGDGREYVYELRAQPNLMTTKVKIGKGINTTYLAWELVTEGQDFDLDSIEFIPMTRERRV